MQMTILNGKGVSTMVGWPSGKRTVRQTEDVRLGLFSLLRRGIVKDLDAAIVDLREIRKDKTYRFRHDDRAELRVMIVEAEDKLRTLRNIARV